MALGKVEQLANARRSHAGCTGLRIWRNRPGGYGAGRACPARDIGRSVVGTIRLELGQVLMKRDGRVFDRTVFGVQQGNVLGQGVLAERAEAIDRAAACQLVVVPRAEVLPPAGVLLEPFGKRRGRRSFAEPADDVTPFGEIASQPHRPHPQTESVA
jgi:hypothetical protein